MNSKSGFTLIEIAITLTIIGIIISAIAVGQAMMDSARVGHTIRDIEKFKTALNAFSLRYDAIPGDFNEAENYWGAGVTNNGNQNNIISAGVEDVLVWQHLGLAGLISNQYTGTFATPNDYVIDVNMPRSKGFEKGGYWLVESTPADTHPSAPESANTIILGAKNSSNALLNGVMSPSDALQIDIKIDDEVATTGDFMALNGTDGGACLTAGAWNVSSNLDECAIVFWLSR